MTQAGRGSLKDSSIIDKKNNLLSYTLEVT